MATATEHAFGGVEVGDFRGGIEGVEEDIGGVPETVRFERKESSADRMKRGEAMTYNAIAAANCEWFAVRGLWDRRASLLTEHESRPIIWDSTIKDEIHSILIRYPKWLKIGVANTFNRNQRVWEIAGPAGMLVNFVVEVAAPVRDAMVEKFVGELLPEIRLRRTKPEFCRATVAGTCSSSRLRGLVIHSRLRAAG